METSQSAGLGGRKWQGSFRERLKYDKEAGESPNWSPPLEDPVFLKTVLAAFLSMAGQNSGFYDIEVARVLDLDFLDGVLNDCEISFRLVTDYGGRDYLEISVHGPSPTVAGSEKPGLLCYPI